MAIFRSVKSCPWLNFQAFRHRFTRTYTAFASPYRVLCWSTRPFLEIGSISQVEGVAFPKVRRRFILFKVWALAWGVCRLDLFRPPIRYGNAAGPPHRD